MFMFDGCILGSDNGSAPLLASTSLLTETPPGHFDDANASPFIIATIVVASLVVLVCRLGNGVCYIGQHCVVHYRYASFFCCNGSVTPTRRKEKMSMVKHQLNSGPTIPNMLRSVCCFRWYHAVLCSRISGTLRSIYDVCLERIFGSSHLPRRGVVF